MSKGEKGPSLSVCFKERNPSQKPPPLILPHILWCQRASHAHTQSNPWGKGRNKTTIINVDHLDLPPGEECIWAKATRAQILEDIAQTVVSWAGVHNNPLWFLTALFKCD